MKQIILALIILASCRSSPVIASQELTNQQASTNAMFYRAVPVQAINTNGLILLNVNQTNTAKVSNKVVDSPKLIMGEIQSEIHTNWIDDSITKKLPEDPHEYTLHQIGTITTNEYVIFKYNGREFRFNVGINEYAQKRLRRDQVHKKRFQENIVLPPIPTAITNNVRTPFGFTELPYSIQIKTNQ